MYAAIPLPLSIVYNKHAEILDSYMFSVREDQFTRFQLFCVREPVFLYSLITSPKVDQSLELFSTGQNDMKEQVVLGEKTFFYCYTKLSMDNLPCLQDARVKVVQNLWTTNDWSNLKLMSWEEIPHLIVPRRPGTREWIVQWSRNEPNMTSKTKSQWNDS